MKFDNIYFYSSSITGGAVLVAIPKFMMGPYTAAVERSTDFCFVNTTAEAANDLLEHSCHAVTEPSYYRSTKFSYDPLL